MGGHAGDRTPAHAARACLGRPGPHARPWVRVAPHAAPQALDGRRVLVGGLRPTLLTLARRRSACRPARRSRAPARSACQGSWRERSPRAQAPGLRGRRRRSAAGGLGGGLRRRAAGRTSSANGHRRRRARRAPHRSTVGADLCACRPVRAARGASPGGRQGGAGARARRRPGACMVLGSLPRVADGGRRAGPVRRARRFVLCGSAPGLPPPTRAAVRPARPAAGLDGSAPDRPVLLAEATGPDRGWHPRPPRRDARGQVDDMGKERPGARRDGPDPPSTARATSARCGGPWRSSPRAVRSREGTRSLGRRAAPAAASHAGEAAAPGRRSRAGRVAGTTHHRRAPPAGDPGPLGPRAAARRR